jgi:hypothetical protein
MGMNPETVGKSHATPDPKGPWHPKDKSPLMDYLNRSGLEHMPQRTMGPPPNGKCQTTRDITQCTKWITERKNGNQHRPFEMTLIQHHPTDQNGCMYVQQ